MSDEVSLYQEVGGSDFFIELVNKFYEGVINDEVIISLYPDRNDLEGAKERLSLFLFDGMTFSCCLGRRAAFIFLVSFLSL